MNLKEEVRYFLIITFVLFFIDISTAWNTNYKLCNHDINFLTYLFLHHLIFTFVLIAWMSSNIYIVYLQFILTFIFFCHWKCNNNKCVMTLEIQKKCKKEIPFRSIIYLLNLNDYYYFIFGLFLLISCYRIYLFHKNNLTTLINIQDIITRT